MLRNYIGSCAIFLLSYEFKVILCYCNRIWSQTNFKNDLLDHTIIALSKLFLPSATDSTENLQEMPLNWPCEWNNGIIPYTLNFFLSSPRRLISIVYRGVKYIEYRSCLKFKEEKPISVATGDSSIKYLYFTYSDVLENCCLPFSSTYLKRRIVLITPLCTSPAETAHAILHAMGLNHKKNEPFTRYTALKVLFPMNCTRIVSQYTGI